MQPLFSFAFLFSVAVALGAQDSDLTKEPWRGDQSKPKLCGFKLGLFLFLANAFFSLSFFCTSLVWFPAPPAQAGYFVSPLGLGH